MSLNEPFMSERYEGESLSSWIFRQRCKARKLPYNGDLAFPHPLRRDESLLSEAIPLHDFDQGLSRSMAQAFADRIHLPYHLLATQLCSVTGVDKHFSELYGYSTRTLDAPWVGTVIIPLKYRCSYCYQCVEEGIKATGMPITKARWRHVLMPFCLTHLSLLYDAPGKTSLREDFPSAVFKHHWGQCYADTRIDEHIRSDITRLALGMRVQQKLIALWSGTPDESLRCAILGFVLTLFRMVLDPAYRWAYSRTDILTGGGHYTASGFYAEFYERPLRATAFARARALYIVGLLLGWIDEDETQAPEVWDAFTPRCASDIWARLPHCGALRLWVKRELSLYENNMFSRESLCDTPYGW
ncbi:hypothetical protein [Pseudomonas syringae]|uniref:hypothetical protein n=1 Tax=Pseudomonas syringae TaxID=317 RepID=UPI003F74C3F1